MNSQNTNILLSYKHLRKINIDTTNPEMKLGKGNFTMFFDISHQQDGQAVSYDNSNFNTGVVKNDITPYNNDNTFFTTTEDSFFPIFTYNDTLLYDHFNANKKDYFYNVHCCYIYKGVVHQLINGITDQPLLHLKVDISDKIVKDSSPNLILILSRCGDLFTLEVVIQRYIRLYADDIEYSQLMIDNAIITNDFDLDIYDTGNLTIGYAERVPTYSYDSYIYKNTLHGNINSFKIFKGVTKTVRHNFNTIIENLQSSTLVRYNVSDEQLLLTSKFENYTNAPKFQIGNKVYHNIGNNKYSINYKYDKYVNANYSIKYVKDYTLYLSALFKDKTMPIDDNWEEYAPNWGSGEGGITFDNKVVDIEAAKNEIPRIQFELEQSIDSTNVNFQQEEFVLSGIYTEDFTEFKDLINIDTTTLSSISDIITFYDLFIRNINGITDDNMSDVNYMTIKPTVMSLINDKIKYYNDNGIIVTNLKIDFPTLHKFTVYVKVWATNGNVNVSLSDENMIENYRSIKSNFDSVQDIQRLLRASNGKGKSYYKGYVETYFSDHIITVDVGGENYTFFKDNTFVHLNSNPNVNLVDNFNMQAKQSNSSDYSLRFQASSLQQYNEFVDEIFIKLSKQFLYKGYENYNNYDIIGSSSWQYKDYSSVAITERIDDHSGYSTYPLHSAFTLPNNWFTRITLEEPNGNVILELTSDDILQYTNNEEPMCRRVADKLGYKKAYFGIFNVMIHMVTGTKFHLCKLNTASLKPRFIAHTEVDYANEVLQPDFAGILDATVSKDLSELIVHFDPIRFEFSDTNILMLGYSSSGMSFNDNYQLVNVPYMDSPYPVKYSTNYTTFNDNELTENIDILNKIYNGKFYFTDDVYTFTFLDRRECVNTHKVNQYNDQFNIDSRCYVQDITALTNSTINSFIIRESKINVNETDNTWYLINEK